VIRNIFWISVGPKFRHIPGLPVERGPLCTSAAVLVQWSTER